MVLIWIDVSIFIALLTVSPYERIERYINSKMHSIMKLLMTYANRVDFGRQRILPIRSGYQKMLKACQREIH